MGNFGSEDDKGIEQRKSKFGFVLPRLQIKFLILLFLTSVGLITITYFLLDYMYYHQLQDFIENTTLSQDELKKITDSLNLFVGYWALICALFSVMMLSFGLFFTRRIAGPLYHISKALHEYFEGNTDRRIRLRKGDELIHFESLINRLIDSIEKNNLTKHIEDKKKSS